MSKFLVAYATLIALKNNLDQNSHEVSEDYVKEFHDSLGNIQNQMGKEIFSVSDFKIDDTLVKPSIASFNHISGEKNYTKKSYCETRILLTKLDAALQYLQLMAPPEEKKQMGFSPEG